MGKQRSHELKQFRTELSEVTAKLAYEQQRVRHYDTCKQLGFDSGNEGWAGLGPSGMGRRTMEVRCEKKLRESAEQRAGRLSRDVTRLSSEAAMHQAEIAKLSKRLHRARNHSLEKAQHIEGAAALTSAMQNKL